MTQKEALKMALEALKTCTYTSSYSKNFSIEKVEEAIAVAEKVLAKPDCCGEPDQCWEPCGELGKSEEHVKVAQLEQDYPTDEHGYPICINGTNADIAKSHAEFEACFAPESIWIGTGHLREILNGNTLNAYCSPDQDRFTDVQLYTTPPQRTWVELTDEEILQGNKESWVELQAWQSAVWWAEKKLKEKNQ